MTMANPLVNKGGQRLIFKSRCHPNLVVVQGYAEYQVPGREEKRRFDFNFYDTAPGLAFTEAQVKDYAVDNELVVGGDWHAIPILEDMPEVNWVH